MNSSDKSRSSAIVIAIITLICSLAANNYCHAESIPSFTAIPVVFTHTLEAGKAKSGDIVVAKTTQAVLLPDKMLPKGATLTGHIVQSTPFVLDPAPYAIQKPSILSIHFDRVAWGASTIPVAVLVRAVSGTVASHEASILHFRDETDSTGKRVLVGGSQFSPLEKKIVSPNGTVVGYNRKLGPFAHLASSDYVSGGSTIHCDATDTEQSLGIFSPNACGVYGLGSDSMTDNGSNGGGTFVLESRRDTVKLYAQSASLLQVVESKF